MEMIDYGELVGSLRQVAHRQRVFGLESADSTILMDKAADTIEELFNAAKAMHTWIFLNSGDEQAAYDECRLSDELNVALGYGGSFEIRYERVGEDK